MIQFFTDHITCPNCGISTNANASTEFIEHKYDVDVIIFNTTCDSCKASWDDFYKLIGHGNLITKGDRE